MSLETSRVCPKEFEDPLNPLTTALRCAHYRSLPFVSLSLSLSLSLSPPFVCEDVLDRVG